MSVDAIDMVNHPPHYISKNGIETINVIEAWTEGLTGIEATDTGNVIKYISRWKQKNGIQDLEKAQWYLNHLIEHVKTSKEYDHYELPEYVFSSYDEIQLIKERLEAIILKFGHATVSDYKIQADHFKDVTVLDGEYGWRQLPGYIITPCAKLTNGKEVVYYLRLPEPIKL